MLHQTFDYQVAEYASVDQIEPEEIAQADIVTVWGHVPGGMYHSRSIRWWGTLQDLADPINHIRSKKERSIARIQAQTLTQLGYTCTVTPLTPDLEAQFSTIYSQTTLNRPRALAMNIKEFTDGKSVAGMETLICGLYEGDQLVAGLLLYVKRAEAFVTLAAKPRVGDIRGGLGGILETELLQFCHRQNITRISHGKSGNPVGLSGKAGIFEFKSRYGFTAYPEDEWRTSFVLNPTIRLSDLLFVTIKDGDIAYMVISEDPEELIRKKYACRYVKNIILLKPDELAAQSQAALQQYL